MLEYALPIEDGDNDNEQFKTFFSLFQKSD